MEDNGTTVRRRPDGTIVKKKADGTIIHRKPDGTIIRRKPDGTIERKKSKGTPSGNVAKSQENEENNEKLNNEKLSSKKISNEKLTNEKLNKGQAKKAKKPKKAPKKKKKGLAGCFVIVLIVMLILGAIGAVILYRHYGPTKEKADLNNYYELESENQLAIVLDNEVIETKGITADGQAYIPYEIVRDNINDRFYWDSNEQKLLYSLPEETISVEPDATEYSVGGEAKTQDFALVKVDGSTAYIALDFIKTYSNIDGAYYENPSRAVIVTATDEIQVATIKKDTQVRFRGGVKSPILSEVKKGDEVTFIEKESDWRKVCTKDGLIGYVRDNKLKNVRTKKVKRDYVEPEYTSIKKDYTISMAWHQVTSEAANDTLSDVMKNVKGLNTISPTWFTVTNTKGDIRSIASKSYVSKAHKSGLEVWALINDFDGGIHSSDETLKLLSSTSSRTNLVSSIISYAKSAGVDGINVDFEKVSDECGEHYIQFIRELSIQCRKEKLVLSIDNYVPKGYNTHYHRAEQGTVADYVVIMGYDEHFAGSLEAGSVASYTYVKEGIEETLKEVPAEKVINAIPFYTRLWHETPKSDKQLASEAGTEAADYPNKITSETLDMAKAAATVTANNAKATWDDTTKQNYAEWKDSKGTYKIWLEDSKSIQAKLDLMKENNLAGVSAWKLGFESAKVWDEIAAYVK